MGDPKGRKEVFRKDLESAGVIDAPRKVLVSLYDEPDKPKQGTDYMKTCLGGPTPAEHEALLAERELLRQELADARQQIEELQSQAFLSRLLLLLGSFVIVCLLLL